MSNLNTEGDMKINKMDSNWWYVVSSFKQCFFNEKDEKETLIEKDELNEETFDGFFEL